MPLPRVLLLPLAFLLAACASPAPRRAEMPPLEPTGAADRVHIPSEWQPSGLPGLALGAELPESGPELSLEEAVVLALRRQPGLLAQQLNPVIAGAFEAIERGEFDAEWFASATASRDRAQETARATGEQFEVSGRDREVRAGVRQDWVTGTGVEASVGHAQRSSDRTPEQQTARLGLSLTQSLLRGRRPEVNLVRIRQAELATMASAYELRGFTEALIARTETAYWELVLAQERIRIVERSLTVARGQVADLRQGVEVGSVAPTDAIVAEAEAARRAQDLIDAQSNLQTQRLRLEYQVAAPPAPVGAPPLVAVSPARVEVPEQPEEGIEARLGLADRMRADLNEARLRIQRDELEVVATRDGLLPRLDLFVNLAKTGFASSLGDAFSNLDGNTYEVRAGLSLSQAVGRQAAQAREVVARATRDQSEAALDNARRLAARDVRLAWTEVERARAQTEAAAETRALQEEVVRAELQRFEVGTSTALMVAQAQRDLLAAEIAEAEAVIQHRLALIGLHVAEGTLLERRGIAVGVIRDP